MCIYGDENLYSHFKESAYIFVDGTFKVKPKEFEQLYMVMGIINNKSVPYATSCFTEANNIGSRRTGMLGVSKCVVQFIKQ